MAWLVFEPPPDENGFHKLYGNTAPFSTDFLLTFRSHSFAIERLIAALVDVLPEVESDMHGYVWCMPALDLQKHGSINKHGYLSASDTVMMVIIVLYTDKLGIPYNLYIYLFKWNLITYPARGTWRLPPDMCLSYRNHLGTSELQSHQFSTFSVAKNVSFSGFFRSYKSCLDRIYFPVWTTHRIN